MCHSYVINKSHMGGHKDMRLKDRHHIRVSRQVMYKPVRAIQLLMGEKKPHVIKKKASIYSRCPKHFLAFALLGRPEGLLIR